MRILWGLIKVGFTMALLAAVVGGAFLIAIRWATSTPSVPVPNVVGLSQAEASRRVDAVGLRIHFEEDDKNQFDERVAPGNVLRQEPVPGTALKRDRKVRVILSLGPRHLYIPRVVGELLNAAQIKIQQAGLKVGDVVSVPSSRSVENTVLGQDASPAGREGDGVIHLLVSSGPADVAALMPDLIGKPALRVRAFLEVKGFHVAVEREVYDGLPEGTVVRQKPLAGYQVRSNDAIRLWTSTASAQGLR